MFDTFIGLLRDRQPFSFSRWGDGEWASLLQMEGEHRANTDGHRYYEDMGEALDQVLISKPKYYLGMQRFAREERYPNEINEFLDQHKLNTLNWVNADVWHHASIKGYFDQFFDVLVKSDAPVILVGPEYLKDLGKFYNVHITIPEKNCWLERERVIGEVEKYLIEANNSAGMINVIVLFVASMPANYMIDELYKKYGEDHTFLDMGSVFDPFVGKMTRSYHKKIVERLNS